MLHKLILTALLLSTIGSQGLMSQGGSHPYLRTGTTFAEWKGTLRPLRITCPASSEVTGTVLVGDVRAACTVMATSELSVRPLLFVLGFAAPPTDTATIRSITVSNFWASDRDRQRLSVSLGLNSAGTSTAVSLPGRTCNEVISISELPMGGYRVHLRALNAETKASCKRDPKMNGDSPWMRL
jgi:hypothetical protein